MEMKKLTLQELREMNESAEPVPETDSADQAENPSPEQAEFEGGTSGATDAGTPRVQSPACEPARPASDARLRVNTKSTGSSDSSAPSGCPPARKESVFDGGLLVEQLEQLYRAHLKLDAGLFLVFALWNLHTFLFELFAVTPYIWLHSPTAGCGKTTAADLLAYASHDSEFTVNISKAALYHVIDQQRPTLIMDEAEGDLDDREMRSLINAGYRRNGGEVKRWIRGRLGSFSVYCPKVIASIRPIPDTVFDRCIKVELKRLRDDEEVAQFDASAAGGELPTAISDWAGIHREAIGKLYRSLPDPAFLHAREASIWKPIFTVAEYVCPARVPELQQTVLRLKEEKTLHGQETAPELKLLSDIRAVFERSSGRKLATDTLLQGLEQLPESCWRGIDSLALAKKLHPFDIRPKQLWLHGKNFRGYDVADFQDAFHRYLLAAPSRDGAPDVADIAVPTTTKSNSACTEIIMRDSIVSESRHHECDQPLDTARVPESTLETAGQEPQHASPELPESVSATECPPTQDSEDNHPVPATTHLQRTEGTKREPMQQQQRTDTLFPRLAEYVSQSQNQRQMIENAVELTERTKSERGDAVILVLANPAPTADGVVGWTAVDPSYPDFHEAVNDRIGRGYVPLGVLDVKTATGIIFSHVVPEPVRPEYVKFAKAQTLIVYETITGNKAPQDSWLESGVIALEIAEKNEAD